MIFVYLYQLRLCECYWRYWAPRATVRNFRLVVDRRAA